MATKPRITILCQLFYPELFTGQTLTELAEQLTELGVDVDVICGPLTLVDRSRVPRYIEHKGIRIRRVWGTQFPKIETVGRLINVSTFFASALVRALFSRDRSPFLVLTNPPFLPLISVLCKWLHRRPYIFLVFDIYPEIAVRSGMFRQESIVRRLWDKMNQLICHNADRIIVLGDCMARVVRAENKLGEKRADRLEVVHIWCDDEHIHPVERSESLLLREWGFRDKFLVQYSGNMGRMHDVETILQAARALQDRPDIHFQFVGEGYKKSSMQAYAQEHALGNCSFHSYVPRESLPDSLAAASAGIVSLDKPFTGLAVPSKMFGIMASGRPVLAVMEKSSEAGGIVERYGCGAVVEPGDVEGLTAAIVRMADSPELCLEMGRKANAALRERYTLRRAAERYRDIIASVAR